MLLPTIKVVDRSPIGFRIINKADFDEERHERFVAAVHETTAQERFRLERRGAYYYAFDGSTQLNKKGLRQAAALVLLDTARAASV